VNNEERFGRLRTDDEGDKLLPSTSNMVSWFIIGKLIILSTAGGNKLAFGLTKCSILMWWRLLVDPVMETFQLSS